MKSNTLIILGIFGVVGAIIVGAVVWQESQRNSSANVSGGLVFSQAVGKVAPDFTLPGFNDKTYKLSELRGKNVILFFNEGVMCYPACWNQVLELGKDKRFEELNTLAFSVVIDTKERWAQAVQKMPELSQANVLLDTTLAVSKNYGILLLPSSMHQGSMPGHTYLLIDKEGIIRYTLDDPQMGLRNEELLGQVRKL